MSTKRALLWVLFWVSLAAVFGVGVLFFEGSQKALEFLGGYVIELSLSVDNLFLFIIVFSCFGVKPEYQRRVLNYGIMGAIILRLIFIVLGVSIVNRFEWVLYVFGLILIYSGIKMVFKNDEATDFGNSRIIKVLNKIIPCTDCIEGEKFFIRINNVLHATPLFAILIVIEFTDILFAIDSIPAIFSITTDPFIVYSSNIFAILGLRSMFFVLGKLHEKFKYVKYGVAMILAFTGIKLSILFFHIKIPIELSLGIIFGILGASVIASVVLSKKKGDGSSEPDNICDSGVDGNILSGRQ